MSILSKSMLFAACSAAAIVSPLHAQTAAPKPGAASGLEDIVVTAQRRSESVQNVPIAVSAFSPAELERRNISSALDVIQYVPNLMGSNNTGLGTANAYYLRGLGNTESIATFDPPVGTYIDDIYVSRQNGNNFSFFDVSRIEVLRGPQGTLFGRNTTGGAVSVYLAKPAAEFGGFLEASYGRFEHVGGRGAISVPIAAGFRTKLSAYYNDDNGYAFNPTTGETLNDQHNYGVRAAAQADISDAITWDTSILYTRDQGTNILNFDCNPYDRTKCKGRFVTTGLRKNFPKGQTQYVTAAGLPLGVSGRKANFPLGNDVQSYILTSNLEVKFDAVTMNVITGYVEVGQKFNIDFFDGRGGPAIGFVAGPGGLPIASALTTAGTNVNPYPAIRGFRTGGFDVINDGSHKQFTQELKFNGKALGDRIDYVAGLYYIKEDNTTDFADAFTSTAVPGAFGLPLLLADRIVKNSTRAIAGYAQLDFSITDQLKLTGGVRYTDEKKTVGVTDSRAACLVAVPPTTCLFTSNLTAAGVPVAQTTKIWTPRVALNFKPTDDILLFASATKGFKSGGWNARSTAPVLFLPFNKETVWSYEAGLKSEWLDKRLRINLTGFWSDTKGYQIPSAFLNPLSGALTFITRNFADFRNKGIEAEFQAVPIDGLTLFATLGLQDPSFRNIEAATLTQQSRCRAALAGSVDPQGDARTTIARAQAFCGQGVVAIDGTIAKPVRTPKITLAGGFNYEYDIAGIGTLTPSVNATYVGKQEVGTSNLTIYRDSAGVFNAYAGEFITGSASRAVVRVNASLAYETLDKNWRLSGECSNCFGTVQIQSVLSNYSYLSPPTTWTVKLRRKF